MSNEILFRTQLASIMEVLANAAVEEISKLVDDGYAVLHLQMSEYQKENEDLKMRLHLMELNTRRCADSPPDPYSHGALALREKLRGAAKEGPATVAGTRVHGSPGDVCLQGLHPAVDEDIPATAFGLKQVETAEAENDGGELIVIKEETTEDYNHPPADLKTPVQGALDSATGGEDGVPAPGLRVSPEESSEELPEQHRPGPGTGVWEVSGLEAVLRLQAESAAVQRLGNAGPERGAGRLRARGSRADPVCRIPGRAPIPAEVKDRPRSLRGGNLARCPAPAALRPVSSQRTSLRARLSPPDSSALAADVVVIDSVKEEAPLAEQDKESSDAQHGRRCDDGEAEEPLHPSSLSRDWPTGREIAAAAPDSDPGGLNELVACKRSFGASDNFAAGSNNPAKEKRFICRYCGKAFSRQNALEIHQRVHTGEKPFRCAQCGKRFSDSSNHRRHQSVHSRERPFSCTQCERSFSHHYQLKVHQRVHTGDQPYACVHCGKKFGEKTFLRLHHQREHGPLYAP